MKEVFTKDIYDSIQKVKAGLIECSGIENNDSSKDSEARNKILELIGDINTFNFKDKKEVQDYTSLYSKISLTLNLILPFTMAKTFFGGPYRTKLGIKLLEVDKEFKTKDAEIAKKLQQQESSNSSTTTASSSDVSLREISERLKQLENNRKEDQEKVKILEKKVEESDNKINLVGFAVKDLSALRIDFLPREVTDKINAVIKALGNEEIKLLEPPKMPLNNDPTATPLPANDKNDNPYRQMDANVQKLQKEKDAVNFEKKMLEDALSDWRLKAVIDLTNFAKKQQGLLQSTTSSTVNTLYTPAANKDEIAIANKAISLILLNPESKKFEIMKDIDAIFQEGQYSKVDSKLLDEIKKIIEDIRANQCSDTMSFPEENKKQALHEYWQRINWAYYGINNDKNPTFLLHNDDARRLCYKQFEVTNSRASSSFQSILK